MKQTFVSVIHPEVQHSNYWRFHVVIQFSHTQSNGNEPLALDKALQYYGMARTGRDLHKAIKLAAHLCFFRGFHRDHPGSGALGLLVSIVLDLLHLGMAF